MALVDLTMPISPDMRRSPSHFSPQFEEYADLDVDGFIASRLLLSSHSGTHVDAPAHFVPNGSSIDKIPLDALIGDAQVIRIEITGPSQPIDAEQLGRIVSSRVLINTGWSDYRLGDENYFNDHPILTEGAAHYLTENCVRLVGIDSPSVDHHPPSTVHKVLLENGVFLCENLVSLGKLPDSCTVLALPLKLVGVDASPARVVGMYEETTE